MADALFEHPRLAAVYDALDPDRSDLDVYAALVTELGARRALDVGCGTGTFALMLAERGVDVVAVDPPVASLDVARDKSGSGRVRWVHGDATAVPEELDGLVDLAVMTANVAQAIIEEQDWSRTLGAVRRCLRTAEAYVMAGQEHPMALAARQAVQQPEVENEVQQAMTAVLRAANEDAAAFLVHSPYVVHELHHHSRARTARY